MSWVTLVVLVLVVASTVLAGLAWRRRTGQVRAQPAADRLDPDLLAGLGVDPGGARATLVQFSTAFCQPCRATRQVLGRVTDLLPDVRHVEVDAESHLDAVRSLGVLKTPTVLVVDHDGRLVARAAGQPRLHDVIAAVAPLVHRPS